MEEEESDRRIKLTSHSCDYEDYAETSVSIKKTTRCHNPGTGFVNFIAKKTKRTITFLGHDAMNSRDAYRCFGVKYCLHVQRG
jgi:hypothetical protein